MMCRKELNILTRDFASALRGEVAASPSQHGPEHVIVLVPNHVRSLRLQGPHHQGPIVDAFGHGDAKRIVGVLRVDAEILGIVRLLLDVNLRVARLDGQLPLLALLVARLRQLFLLLAENLRVAFLVDGLTNLENLAATPFCRCRTG